MAFQRAMRDFARLFREVADLAQLWASGYDVYDRLSKPYQQFLEGLTATYAQPRFNAAADENKFKLYSGERGSPENVGDKLEAIHPVVRTNPVT